ncbi:hypothetical protein IAI10_13205 [Clostridium sp. 19966]|uniref:hypothetical protein n=1 Tax=Clostridium sp. 19966 TaxID=2768166 RepID=UPI0028DDB0FE|nr:hypothetical protein [Clostridium sp. 19966]MDT8717624.1 hypothetical protein [Clostridium sp. 19966]
MKSSKKSRVIEGQISFWEISVEKKEIKAEIEEKANSFRQLSQQHKKLVDIYKLKKNVRRIIKYWGGGLGVELDLGYEVKTLYFNAQGNQEFIMNKDSEVLPMDKIVYTSIEEMKLSEKQKRMIKDIDCLKELQAEKVFVRKGDSNITVICKDKIQSINQKGWILDFKNIDASFDNEEIFKEFPLQVSSESLQDIQGKITVGDYVEALIGDKLVSGEIVREYGIENAILNISYDNHTKQTAIGRFCVQRLIRKATA